MITKCNLIFKTEACGYLGPEDWCNQTFERCRNLSNEQRFSGRYAPGPPPHPVYLQVFHDTLKNVFKCFDGHKWVTADETKDKAIIKHLNKIKTTMWIQLA